MLPGWAVIVTQPQLEAKVVARVGKLGYRVFYPKIVRRLRHKGKRISIMCPLFPGYLFTWIEMKWAGLLNVNGVAGLLMNDGELAIVGDPVMNELKSRCDRNGIYFNPIRKFSKGQKVRIEYGFFAGMLGTVERFSKREDEVILLMDVLGAKRPVKVSEGALTKV